MPNYSKRVNCTECGNSFPKSETKLLSFGKNVLRLCLADYEVKEATTTRLAAQAAEKAADLQAQAKENIKKAKER